MYFFLEGIETLLLTKNNETDSSIVYIVKVENRDSNFL